MKRADIRAGDRLNYRNPSDWYDRDCEVVVVDDGAWDLRSTSDRSTKIACSVDGVIREINLDSDIRRSPNGGNGVLVVLAETWGRDASALVVQLRYLTPWTEENEAKAVAARELDKQVRQAHMRAFRIGAR